MSKILTNTVKKTSIWTVVLTYILAAAVAFGIVFGIGSALALITSLVFLRMFNALLLPLAKDKEKFLKACKEVA